MRSSSVALAAMLGYLLPPVFMLLGAIVGDHYFAGDASAVLGLLLAQLISRFTLGLLVCRLRFCLPPITSGFHLYGEHQ